MRIANKASISQGAKSNFTARNKSSIEHSHTCAEEKVAATARHQSSV
jgi:hypothetical protein